MLYSPYNNNTKESIMFFINKITSNPTVDFAAEELKKYLRMMMPFCGEIKIIYDTKAKDGFRLGLMSDFGIDTSEAENLELDDIMHIDTDCQGGIIAGSNPRSVLLSVYRYLTINGCRWLFPGVDGEFIPVKDIAPTSFHKMADCRYRGQCNEGAEAQHLMIEAIDFTPKIGMNIFMQEFEIPYGYYSNYYDHKLNNAREPEPVNDQTVLQWKRQCEAEISKRGLQYHDMGHGWTVDPFGISSGGGWGSTQGELSEDQVKYLAMVDGKRQVFKNVPLCTSFCMSNPEARSIVAKYIVDYARLATNVDYLHVWLSDAINNICECDECKKKSPSDWYIMLMNEVDDRLTAEDLNTRIVFICYYDTMWAPTEVKLNNPDRFSLLVAAITRDYTKSVEENLDGSKLQLTEYALNNNKFPTDVNHYIVHAQNWMKHCGVNSLVYEYHYWWPQYRDFGIFDAARILHNDIKGYKSNGCNGLIEDGSQRSYFPNGFSYFVYASTLFDNSVDFEALKEDYFKNAYGEDYKEVIAFFEKLGNTVDFKYLTRRGGGDEHIDPAYTESLRKIPSIVDEFAPFVAAHKTMPYRAQSVAYKLLDKYLTYLRSISEAFALQSEGKKFEATELYENFMYEFGKGELEIERWYDQFMLGGSMRRIFHNRKEEYN